MAAPAKAFCKEKPSIWTIEGKGIFLLKPADSTIVPLFDYKTLHRLPVREVQTMELIFRYLQPLSKRDAYYWITKACYYESIGKKSEAVKVFESCLSHYPEPIEAITSAFRWFLLRLAEAKSFEGREREEQENDKAMQRQEQKIGTALEREEPSWEQNEEKEELELEQAEQKAERELKKEERAFKRAEAKQKIEAENAFKELQTECELVGQTQAFQEKVEKALEEAEAFVERTLTAGIHSQECNESVIGLEERYKMQMESISTHCSQQEYSNSPVYRRVRQELSTGNSPVAASKKPQSEVDDVNAGLEVPPNRIDFLNTPSKRTQAPDNPSVSNLQLLNSPSKDCSSFGLLMRQHHSTPIKNSPLRTPSSCRSKGNLHSCSSSAKRQLNFDEVAGGDSFSGESHSIKYALISTPKKLRGLSTESLIFSPVKRSTRKSSAVQKNVYESIENLPQGVCYVPNPALHGGKPLKASTILSRNLTKSKEDVVAGEESDLAPQPNE